MPTTKPRPKAKSPAKKKVAKKKAVKRKTVARKVAKKKTAARRKRLKKQEPDTLLIGLPDDIQAMMGLDPARALAMAQGAPGAGPANEHKSSIFKGESANRMGNLGMTGISNFHRSHMALPVHQGASLAAMPTMGDAPRIEAAIRDMEIQAAASGQKITAEQKIQAFGGGGGGTNTTNVQPFFHTPGNAQDAFNLPKSYIEQIRWSRLMYNLNAYIAAITDLKAYYPYSKFRIESQEPFVTEFYNQVAFNKNFNLYEHILRMSLGYHKFGESIAWGARKMDGTWPKTGKPRWVWDYFILLEPELVEIKKNMIGSNKPSFFLRPSRDLEEMVKKMDAHDAEYQGYEDSIAEPIKEKIRKRDLVPLDANTVSAIQHLTDASATRGTPPYQRLFVTFIYEDFVRLAQMAQANRYHFPIELWTLGDLDKKILPNTADLEKLRDLVTQAIQNPPFSIFFPPILKYEALGVNQKLLSIKADYEYIWRQYTVGMGVSENMILGESGIFSSTETSSNQAFVRARKKDRDQMEEWMTWNFFEPLARWNNLKVKKGAILAPVLPDYEWEKTLDFIAEEQELETAKYLWEKGAYPTKRLLAKNKENPEEIEAEMKAELGTILDDGVRVKAPSIRGTVPGGKPAAPGGGAGGAGGPAPAPGGAGGAGGPAPGGAAGGAGGPAAEPVGEGTTGGGEPGGAGGAPSATPAETAAVL